MVHRILFVLALTASLMGCSTPDGGDIDGFLEKIRKMDPGSGKLARVEEARWRALEALRSDRDPSDVVGEIRCVDGRGHGMNEPIRVRDIIDCLAVTSHMTFALCIEAKVTDVAHMYTTADIDRSPDASCEYVPNKDFATDDKWDPDQITEEDLARSAFASQDGPPSWMMAAGIVAIGAGGVFVFVSGWAVVLCPLDLGYGCPGNPADPGAAPGPGSGPGGDR